MKNIQVYRAEKYQSPAYTEIRNGIYRSGSSYYLSLSFEQEPGYGEGSGSEISQYPLEDILDRYCVQISDFYRELNGQGNTCCLEFMAFEEDDLERLLSIAGKHVYNRTEEKDGKQYVTLVIE